MAQTGLALAAAAVEEPPKKGKLTDFLEISMTESAIQFYRGNFLDGSVRGKGGKTYDRRGGFCLETQHYPDAPNHPGFPSTVLRPGEAFRSTTVLKFGN